jgi:hypothetical protein
MKKLRGVGVGAGYFSRYQYEAWQRIPEVEMAAVFRTSPRLLVYETGVHFLDVFRFLGGEISSVCARLQKRNAAIAGEDAAQIVCGFASGATGMLDASRFNEADTADPRYRSHATAAVVAL